MKQLLYLLTLTITASRLPAQVTQLSNNTDIRSGIALENIGIMAAHGDLWRTDGTAAGTFKYTTKVFIDTSVNTVVLNNKVYFNGKATGFGNELWVTDGTDAGTQLVKDIKAGTGNSSPRKLFAFNNAVYFFAETAASGIELWKSDGTTDGTVMVKDINPGNGNGYDKASSSFFVAGTMLYFDANDGTHGTELWKTDGTTDGTVMVKDINPGADSSACADFATLGNDIVFSAADGTHGRELFKSDGTEAGTGLVKDIDAGEGSSSPQQFVAFNNKLFFVTVTGGSPIGRYLYITDGTEAGTVLLKDFGLLGGALLYNSVYIGDKLYFTANSLLTGLELWSTDGTAAGTSIFKDINTGPASSSALILPDYASLVNGNTDVHTKLFNGKIFFVADDGMHGFELWITDGTAANTHMVKDIHAGADSSFGELSTSWFYADKNLFFVADDGATGAEIYTTDGTSDHTMLLEDINPGSGSSDPVLFMLLKNHIYFTADNGDTAQGVRDLYIIDEEVVLPVTLVDFTAALNGKAVHLEWSTATETNTKTFVIQRSNDAVHFNNIGSVDAAGNSTTTKEYSFIDGGAFAAGARVLYYRLQTVDNDGKISHSNIARVEITPGNNIITVYPNPARDKLTVTPGRPLDKAVIKITDQSGKIVFVQKIAAVQAGEKVSIKVAGLGTGIYYLQCIDGSNKQVVKFIKY